MKTKIDIEKLLHWAVRDELAKGQAVAATPWMIITQYCALGVRVDVSAHGGDGLGFVAGEPCDDALRVADAIKALDRVARFEDVEQALALFGDIAPIATEAARMIQRSTFDPQSLVISYATRGSRPKWNFENPTPCQLFAPTLTGRPRPLVYGVDADGDLIEMRRNEGRARKRDGEYTIKMMPRSPLNWHDPSPLHIGECRAEYLTWHTALVMLAADLAGKLDRFDVLPPSAARAPWIVDNVSRIIPGRDLSAAGVEQGLVPKRPNIAGKPIESPIEAETVASYNRASRTKMRKIAAA